MKPTRLTEFSVYLDQRPGEFAGLLGAAVAAGVNVRAVSVGEHNGKGLVRVVAEPVEAMRSVCEAMVDSGVGPIVESEVLVVSIENRPAAIRDLATAMADHRINLRYAYLMPAENGRPTSCVFKVDDLEDSMATIEGIDWPNGD
jgi:hypothetical protein